MSKTPSRLVAAALGVLAFGAAGCVATVVGGWAVWFTPFPVMKAPVQCEADLPALPRGKRLRVLVWNVQFAAGRSQRFFYDGGTAVSVPQAEVDATLDGIAEVVQRVDPDLIFWQELDVDSARTGRTDQIRALLEKVPYPCVAETPYHKAPYVPHPPTEHLGRVDMRLSIWSRYRIDKATRHDLPRLDESWIRQQFNLKRALLTAELPVEGGGTFLAFDTHLSAFSKGDGTLPRQLAHIAEQLDAADAAGTPWVLGADLNSLPPGDDPARLGKAGDLYEPVSPLTPWFDKYTPAVPLAEHHADPQPFRTWLPYGSNTADRAIDHVFHSAGVEMQAFSVLQDVDGLSDHHPMIFDFRIP